jgi:enediyne biosynthesis protein E4
MNMKPRGTRFLALAGVVLVVGAADAPAQSTGGDKALFTRLAPELTGVSSENRVDGESPLRHLYVHGFGGGGVCVGDYDDDGLPDLFFTGQAGASKLYRQVSPWTFEDVTKEAGVAHEAWDAGPSFVDIDNDGDLDLYVCSYGAPNRLYVNQGDGTFVEEAKEWGLNFSGASVMAAFADYDRDGDLDVYIVTNRIYSPLGEGRTPRTVQRNGHVELEPGFEETHAIQTRRINGHDEMYIVQAGQRDLLLRNDGGRFTDVTASAGIDGYHPGLSVTWWDCNDDGLPDVYVGNDYWDPDFLYRNNGDGTFTNIIDKAVPSTSWFSMGADAADLNGDGLMDFLSADMASTTHFMQKMTMGNMGDTRWFLESAEPRQYMRNALYINTGTERFIEAANLAGLASTDWTWSVKLGDLDNDGRVDAFFTNGSLNRSFNPDFVTKQREMQERLMRTPGVTRREADKAQWDLLQEQPPRVEANLAFRNAGDLLFEPAEKRWGLGDIGLSYGAALADLDRDGDLDVIVSNLNEPAGLYRNESAGGTGVLIRLKGTASNSYGIDAIVTAQTGTSTQTKRLTLARGFMSANEPMLHFGVGEAGRIDRLTVRWPSGIEQVVTSLAAGRVQTIVEPTERAATPRHEPSNEPTDTMFDEVGEQIGLDVRHRERMFDDYAAQPLLPAKHSQLGPGLALGDVDGDGDDDLFVGGASGQAGVLYLYDGGGFLATQDGPWDEDAACEDMAPLWFDADRDGDLDLYVASGSVEADEGSLLLQDRLYLNDGRGMFSKADVGVLPDVRVSSGVVVAADYDRDGDLDLFVGGRVVPGAFPVTPRSVLLRNEGGRFVDASEADAPGLAHAGMVTGALWSDLNDDGLLDLLVTLDWGAIHAYMNEEGRLIDRTSESGLGSFVGWWNGLTGADLDGDGDMDFVATNVGLNTKYHASMARPTLLYYGDFDGTSGSRLLEAEWEDESLFPVRGKSCSQNAMPFVGEAFPTFESYALAQLPQIYGLSKLEKAVQLKATELRTVMLINDGSGRFDVRPLDRPAQVSPGFGVAATDFDGDGIVDIAIAQNWMGPQPETGRWDGGLGALLAGQADGSFASVRADRSGLVAPGDSKGLALVDLDQDGDPDFLVTQNDNRTLAFRNGAGAAAEKMAGRRVAVRLKGLAGNPTGVGSRLILETDSRRQVAEIRAGSGYLSQSSPSAFFVLNGRAAVVVRWPDGAETREVVPADARVMVLVHPDARGAAAEDHR